MPVRRMVPPTVFALSIAAATAATAAALERSTTIEGLPLAQEMVADEKPPPSRASPLADIPLRTRFPSRTFLPGLPEVGFADPASSLAGTDETQLIQLVYDTYSRYSEREDGERVEFELDGFRTLYRPDFAHMAHYPDVMTLSTDWEIDTSIRERWDDGKPQAVWYEAEWVPGKNGPDSPIARELIGRSVLEILALGADQQPDRRRTIAITSYRVRVSFLGRTETYRAAVRWRLDEEQNVQFGVTDNVVREVGFAITEVAKPLAEPAAENPTRPDNGVERIDDGLERIIGASTTTSCYAQTWPTVHSVQEARYDHTEHFSGKHEAVFIGEYDCRCDTSCNQWCDPGHFVEACQDYGTLSHHLLTHETTKRTPIDPGTSGQGHTEAAACASGFGCFIRSCYDGSCDGMTVTVSTGLLSFSFSADRPTILDASLSNHHLCPRCTEQPPAEDDETVEDPALQGCAPWCGSPIVVDLDRGGFRFTDLAGGVRFDLDGDGAAELLSWLVPGSGDGWLALDRDGDGAISTGAELFGDFTPQPPSAAPHGFLALAVLDAPAEGGDGDGRISAADAAFASLRLWIDTDHDGVSRPEELVTLGEAGVVAIDLDFVESHRRDRHGNELRYTSRVELESATTLCTDVFLLRGE